MVARWRITAGNRVATWFEWLSEWAQERAWRLKRCEHCGVVKFYEEPAEPCRTRCGYGNK